MREQLAPACVFAPEQPDLAGRLTPTGGVRLRRRRYLIIAAVRGLYTATRSTPVTLARRAAPTPPARAALRGLSPAPACLELLLPNGLLTVCALLQVASSPGTSVVCKKLIERHD